MKTGSPQLSIVSPVRVLGPVDATCVVIGAVIGVGIFFNPSQIADLVGSPVLVLLSWGLAGVIAMCGALVFAELGGNYNSSGAQYDVLRDSYGRFPAFLFVFCNATATQAGSIGIIALVCAANIAAVIGIDAKQSTLILLMALTLIGGVTIANAVGVRWGAAIQNFTVYAKVLTLLVVTALAMVFAPESHEIAIQSATTLEAERLLPVAAVMAALVPAFFAYGGWQQALWVAGEIREPTRNLPRAIILGMLVVVAVYLLVNWAYLALLGVDGVAQSGTLASDAVAAALPNWSNLAPRIIAGAVAISAFGVLNAQLLTGPRLIYALAADGRFFPIFATVHERFRTPLPAIALLTLLAVMLLLIAGEAGLDRLVTGVVFIDGVFMALTGCAVLVLRYRKRRGKFAKRLPGTVIAALLFVIGEIGLLVGAYLDYSMRIAAIIGVGWIAFAAVIYWGWFKAQNAAVDNQPAK